MSVAMLASDQSEPMRFFSSGVTSTSVSSIAVVTAASPFGNRVRPALATRATGASVAELAAHQMKRHQRALDGCLAAAHKRAPAAAGTLTLDFDVSDRKVKSVSVSDDGVHDAQLASCLTSTARSFTFSLAAARFRWPVALSR